MGGVKRRKVKGRSGRRERNGDGMEEWRLWEEWVVRQ